MNRAPRGTHAWGSRPPLDDLIVEEYQEELATGVSMEKAIDNVVAKWVKEDLVARVQYNRFRIRVTNAVERHNERAFKMLAQHSGLEEL